MSYVLALDQGTTSSRAILFDAEGRPRARAQAEFEQHYPQPGWVEHDAEEIWATQARVATQALAEAGVSARDVAAVGITNQRETTVAWDAATGRALAPAIVWQDRRTAAACDRLRAAGHEDAIRARTGLLLDAYFSATKMAWLLEHVPAVRAAADAGTLRFGTIDSWLVHRLTGGRVHATDPSNASRTLLYDIHAGDWSDELLARFGIPRATLPQVVPSSGVVGEVVTPPELAGMPIAGIAGDQQAALFGQGCLAAGEAKCTYGTGCFLLLNTGAKAPASEHRLLTTVAWEVGGARCYALEGSVFIGGAVVQWLRDGLGLIERSADAARLAATVEDNGGVYLVPAFAGLGAPHWDPHARGTMVGLTRGTQAGHVMRAALESIAFQVADVLDAMQADAGLALPALRVDGGASVNEMLMQFQADLLGIPLERPAVTETTALGAAWLAGLGVGAFSEPRLPHATRRRFEPAMDRQEAARLRGRWRDAVERSRGWERVP